MENVYLDELIGLVYEINNTKNRRRKCEKILRFSSYGAYLYYTGRINSIEFDCIIKKINNDVEEKYYNRERNKCVRELYKNNDILFDFFREMALVYQKYEIEAKDDDFNKNIYKDLIEFMKYMNCYDIFLKLKDMRHISQETSRLDHSICIDNRDESYIILKNKSFFHNCLDLSHEIAHAYENTILKNRKKYFDSNYNVEIMSITFNRIFIEFLYQKGSITKEEKICLLNNFELNYNNFTDWSLFISAAMMTKHFDIFDYDISIFTDEKVINRSLTDYNYAIGRIVSFHLFDEWKKNDRDFIKSIPDMTEHIRNLKIRDLVNKYGDLSVANRELAKTFVKRY